ncbi:glycosyltransferase family 2 protein [Cricetibacter osteomyelitidis]|nr:glycosyltransferase family 2 protein [Cricetibacter osteomyelitidis]
MKISILIITYGRVKELLETLDSIVKYTGQDNVELLVLDNNPNNQLEKSILDITSKNIKLLTSYFHDGKNYGVALGRNYLIEKAQGDILVTLDDDVEIDNITALLERIISEFTLSNDIGALAFNIKNFYTRKSLRHEIPHGNKKLDFTRDMDTYYFIGAGHAIKKEVYQKSGLYPDDLGIYGGEERDLSFRILEMGYRIRYISELVIFHKVSPDGRLPREEEDYYRYRNQLIVLNRYMPFVYRWTSNIIWSLFYFIKKKGRISAVFKTLKLVIMKEKNTISDDTLKNIKKLNGRILF